MDSFGVKAAWNHGGKTYSIFRLDALEKAGFKVTRLPYSLKILLENLLRNEGLGSVDKGHIAALAEWDPKKKSSSEIAFTPARTLLQDFTGVPCVVDLAAMRDAMSSLKGNPEKINPLTPVELVIDHSVQVDAYGSEAALLINRDLEFERNQERYQFLKWGQAAFQNFQVVPPNTGIVHQVNLEYLARVVMSDKDGQAFPDTLVGTDSHTTMVNGLGVLGWGVGGIEAEASMLGQPISMLIPQVVGFKLSGKLSEGATATDLVLTVTEMLRKKGVVGSFVEFYGPGLKGLPVADRATIGNMAPEYGATCGIFPIDEETLKYFRLTGRTDEQIAFVEAYAKEQGLFHNPDDATAEYSDTLELDLAKVEPSVAGPKRPQDRFPLSQARKSFHEAFVSILPGENGPKMTSEGGPPVPTHGSGATAVLEKASPAALLSHGSVVIAAITSCTNTSNPTVMVAAGLVARNAVQKGLNVRPWVKTSLAPGSRVVTSYLKQSGLLHFLEELKFNVVGYGCTTCIGNSGPLDEAISEEIFERDLVVVSVLSGNRNFEGRINSDVKANYLMSPPLVVAYALAGTIEIDLQKDPIGIGSDGKEVFLKDLWPSQQEIAETVASCVTSGQFRSNYASVYEGDEKWKAIEIKGSERFAWEDKSTYIKNPPYFVGMPPRAPSHIESPTGMKVLALLGDSVTTDHISPAGSIKANSPAGQYLTAHNVPPNLFNSYGARRGNHEVMMRGTFANIRLRNLLAPGTEGGFTTFLPTGDVMTIFDATEKYREMGIPLIVLAGKEYGTGSSRDWAAKGPALLGVRAVIAESFERIHRSNLVGMGVVPLEFKSGQGISSLGLTGHEEFSIPEFSEAIESGFKSGKVLTVRATDEKGNVKTFEATVRIDTPQEVQYYSHGGILHFVLRQLMGTA